MGLFNKIEKTTTSCGCGDVKSLIIKKNLETEGGQETEAKDSGCGEDGCEVANVAKKNGHVIKVLGSGCKNCITLGDNVKKALGEMKLEASIVKVTDIGEITRYGVMSTPALVVNEKVVSYGKVLKSQEIIKILEKAIG
jgi:small redox-active disulfide protein 2